ncbi:MAG: hypothetical protein HY922_15250 [Elusimicrobia bacterium]|nr:hypothetical protein [Elusimicrobiota bacterium]
MSDSTDTDRISSPVSTGGGGTFFEQHVDAYWLAQLLVRGIPPILLDCAVVEVHFQTEHLGWHTDDFLVVGQNGAGESRKLAGQVKRSFTVSATDEDCKKAVQDFWKDFKNPRQFSPVKDRFALVTQRGTNALLEHFSGLLDCARAARDAADFEHRLSSKGFISAKAIRYCSDIRAIIGEAEGRSVSASEIWSFLRALHVLSLDLNSGTRQTEAMIKTLLACTAVGQDQAGAAEASWNSLLREVGEAMPGARSFRRENLPEQVHKRHSPVAGAEHNALRALRDHSALILDSIRSTIGGTLHLGRGRQVQQVLGQLEATQVVLVSGPAGSGKSGIAKDVVSMLSTDYFAFSFRAEEFAHPHFDATLQNAQIPTSAAKLGAILAGQGRKVLLVESIERLLEKPTRDAFTDLLTLVARDKSWQIILTCRDYSADLVRAGLLESAGVGHSVVTVPPLDDDELREVEAANPTLARPLGNATLRRLLRNPYFLDNALKIDWSDQRPLPLSERDFRARFWQTIVRHEHCPGAGLPRRREETFVQVALRRARALTLYASCGDLDAEAIGALQRDSLLALSTGKDIFAAPAHDVLEDWAILHWLDEQYAAHGASVRQLSSVIGAHPALRRTYRKWVNELVEREPETADRIFLAILHEAAVPAQFQDDTLVALLQSSAPGRLLDTHAAELFADDRRHLQRLIHLLRVACVTAPTWLETTAACASLLNVPDGAAWACIMRLVQSHLQDFTEGDHPLLLGLIEDWARGVSWESPYPEGAESAAAIAYRLLPAYDNYRTRDQEKRVLKVIAKIPRADRARYADLLQGGTGGKERDRVAEDFRELILEGMDGMPAARDMADVLVSAAKTHLLCTESDIRRDRWGGSSHELEPLFGIKENRSHDYFPASAYRGPFLPLLRYHSREGIAFVIDVHNHSADWYAHPRTGTGLIESPFEITLTFADGSSRKQWCNPRLWNLYRGASVGPNVLQCLLMALERWLLEFAEARSNELDAVLLDILRRSDSTAITAVVAGVATAFPYAAASRLMWKNEKRNLWLG